jgi:outer membrane protein OmpA-like peptidoglycan-associated protein
MKRWMLVVIGLVAAAFFLSGCGPVNWTSEQFPWWGKSGAQSSPTADTTRGGEWWWPEQAPSGQTDTQWGNRGVVYINKSLPVEKPAVTAPVVQEKIVEKIVEKPVIQEKIVEKIVEKPVIQEKIVEKIVEKPVIQEKIVEKIVTKKVYLGLNDVYFNCDSFKLTSLAQAIIKEDAQILKANPEVKVILEGYASPEGPKAHNEELSRQRSGAVQKQLIDEGIAADRLTVNPRGIWEAEETSWPVVRKVHFKIVE